MDYLYLSLATVFFAVSSISGSYYNKCTEKWKNVSVLYIISNLFTVLIFWGISYAIDFSFDVRVLPYSVLLGAFFSTAVAGQLYALKHGPVSLTAFLMQLSLIGTTIWGFFFWDTAFTLFIAVGLALIVISLFLCLYTKEKQTAVSWKWIVFTAMAFFGNAGGTITQKTQQLSFVGQHKTMLMFFAMLFAFFVCLILFMRTDKKDFSAALKKAWCFPVVTGVTNGFLNLFVMLLAVSTLSPSVVYPVIAVGGLLITTLYSFFVFKEKLKWWQWLGVLIGTVAVGILSV